MKKNILALLVFIGFVATTAAQGRGNIEFGLHGGLNSSFISDSWGSSDVRTNFSAGASADFYFSDSWSLKVKGIYDRKGWNNDLVTVNNNVYRANFALDYVTIPVMANFHFGNKRNWYVNFGPYVGFLINAEETAFKTDVKESFNTTDAGLALGFGVKIPLSNYAKLFIEYDVQSGFTEVFKYDFDNGDNARNTRGALNVGINFML
jgi:hypothetical protein